MFEVKEYKFKGHNKKLITADLTYKPGPLSQPICVFVHGIKGFKDWGAWHLAAQIFAIKGLPFFKFNFSHNGTSPANPTEFIDIEAFGNNNLKIEMDELGMVFDFIEQKAETFNFQWNSEIYLIGHSRGGGIALLRAAVDSRITKCATWASVSDFERYVNVANIEEWINTGVQYVENTRTKQQLPMYLQFYENFKLHQKDLDIIAHLEDIKQPLLVVHGEIDNVVPLSDAHAIYEHVPQAILIEVENADHSFNITHPIDGKKITPAFAQVIEETIEFFLM